ncbi:hypothetical protein R1flu_026872 [Riccia fluitans]|uniref:Reverse transcriptase domain-containing protein n=1 Tax=Riccia fluitans TaxID=41844 RepID=A0ABD1XH74_9MARC
MSHFKMDHSVLEDAETLKKAVEAWDAPNWIRDPRKKWNLAWGRVCQVMRSASRNRKLTDSRISELQENVERLRIVTASSPTIENQDRLQQAISSLCSREELEAKIWRTRSRCKWAANGDAPTKYFFHLTKAKFARESITSLETEDGTIKSNQLEINKVIEDHFTRLFNDEPPSEETLQLRRDSLQLLQEKLSSLQKEALEEMPQLVEIEEIIAGMQDEKTPGLDGLTVETVRKLWWKVKDDCIKMVHAVWRKKEISERDRKGVIKLLPKAGNKKNIKNWRPITLMNFTYKLVAKILANRLKALNPLLVDSQQTGFIAGRNITENILALKLGQEWASISRQEAVFLKLDFMKAFDRVSHDYLWELQAQKRGKTRLPSGSLLFALSTQPLMRMLRNAGEQGKIIGVNIGSGKSLLHQLFADDTGICITAEEKYFEATKEIVSSFERISGAKLNLLKSVIMPLTPTAGENWLHNTGREVAGEGRDFTYLGILTGCALDERKLVEEIIRKASDKLAHWSTKWLIQPGRLVLLRHVLAAMPTYQILAVGMSEQGMNRFETLCRNFVWGWNAEGNPRLATIAWWKFALRKEDGGLNWTPTKDRVIALQIRNLGHILIDKQCEWTVIAKTMIKKRIAEGPNKRDRQLWSAQEALLLLNQLTILGAPLLTRMLKIWFKIQKFLRREGNRQEIPAFATVQQLAMLATRYTAEGKEWAPTAARLLASIKIYDAIHLWDSAGRWKSLVTLGFLHRKQWSAAELRCARQWDNWLKSQSPSDKPLHQGQGWNWLKSDQETFSWIKPTSFWKNLLYRHTSLLEELNERWGIQDTEEHWKRRWKSIWKSKFTLRIKVWLWKIYHRGFLTGSRAAKFTSDEGHCHFCRRELETYDHLWWTCSREEPRRNTLLRLLSLREITASNHNFIHFIDFCLKPRKEQLAVGSAFYAYTTQL